MTTQWENEVILHLIELYENNECLWDTTNPEYKNKIRKNIAWESISNELNLPRREIETKIHTLRSQFIRERKKIAPLISSTGGDDSRFTTWFAYEPMRFLLKKPITSAGVDTWDTQASRQDSNDQFSESIIITEYIDAGPTQASHESMERTPPPSTFNKSSKKRPVSYDDKLEEAFDTMRSVKMNILNSQMDEFAVYGQYVASELRAVDDVHSLLVAKYCINKILIEARMGKYTNCSGASSSDNQATKVKTNSEQMDEQISDIVSNIELPNFNKK